MKRHKGKGLDRVDEDIEELLNQEYDPSKDPAPLPTPTAEEKEAEAK